MSHKILVLNGPNLNMLGQREPDIYGHTTLDDIQRAVEARGSQLKLHVDFRQSNNEGELVTAIQSARGQFNGLIINAAAYTHTSVAILDALLSCGMPIVEVHLSNIYRREEFRHHSYVSRAATGVICGFGAHGYELALDAIARLLGTSKQA